MQASEAAAPRRTLPPEVSAILAGLCFAVAWPPIGWWPLAFVALAPFAHAALTARSRRRAFLATTLGFLPAWIWLEWWLLQVTPPGFVALVFYCASYAGLAALLLRETDRGANRTLPLSLLLPIVWCTVELVRARLMLNGYPWFQLGVALLGSDESRGVFAQGASLSGVVVPTFVAACVGGGIADWLLRARRGTVASVRCGIALAVAVPLIAALGGLVMLSGRERPDLPAVEILAVQTDLPVSNKLRWSPEAQMQDVPEFLRLSYDGVLAARAVGRQPDLVVWPETMVPGFGLEPATLDTLEAGGYFPGRIFADALDDLRDAAKAPLLVGSAVAIGLRPDPHDDSWLWDASFNSAYLIDGEPPFVRYDKLFLTPFGETMPLISRWPWLEQRLLAFGAPGMSFTLDAGDRPVRFTVRTARGVDVRFATPICFEDTVPEVCRRLAYEKGRREVDLLLNLSNDGWFGTSDGGRRQHVLHARLRAIELGIPIVRCANTGLSVHIDATGRVVGWIGQNAPGDGRIAGTLLATVSIDARETLFGRFGDAGSWVALLSTALLIARGRRRSMDTDRRLPSAPSGRTSAA